MHLDPRTFIVTTTLAAFVMMIVFFAQARSFPESVKGFKIWGCSLLLISIAAGLIAGRHVLPDVISVVLGNAAMTVSLALMIAALAVFHGKSIPWKLPLLCLVLMVLGMSYAINTDQSYQFRARVATTMNVSMFAIAAWSAFKGRTPSEYQFGVFFTGISFTVMALVCLTRLMTLPEEGVHYEGLLGNDVFQLIYLASFSVTVLLVSVGFNIMGHEKLVENYQALASRDELTGLYNRRRFIELAEQEVRRSERYERNVALLLIDIDSFKSINDTYGHQAGDAVIEDIADVMRGNFREADLYGRYGGEEFIALLPETSIGEAEFVAERMRRIIHQRWVRHEGNEINYSASFGIVQRHPKMELQQMVAQADKALYRAKDNGKNRVEIIQMALQT
ncbi:MAG: GGDEF domain-containing protein [Pseudomonadales bacterium]|nr:GGDEF domain-containing protein [Pseudomonadales bacterium]